MINPSDLSGRLFAEFRMISFVQNIRAAEDLNHQRIQSYFREPRLGLRPVEASKLLHTLKVLSHDDVMRDKSWLDAPVVVADNVKRRAINREQVRRHSLRTKHAVVMWRNTMDAKTTAAFQSCALKYNVPVSTVLDQHEDLLSYFVPGAPARLTENFNPARGLSNGSFAFRFKLSCDLHTFRIALCSSLVDTQPILWT